MYNALQLGILIKPCPMLSHFVVKVKLIIFYSDKHHDPSREKLLLITWL